MAQKDLGLSYDPQADVLYCSYGPPREAVSEETSRGIIIRRDPETREVVGFTVLDFSRRFEEKPGEVLTPVREIEELQHI
jgi:uncharacterized protein YuzE